MTRHIKQKKEGLLSKKGFLFTISVIIFASTLLLYTQSFATTQILERKYVTDFSRHTAEPFINDDLSSDIGRILGLSVDLNYSTDFNLIISDTVPKRFSLVPALTNYDAFLDQNFFPRINGTNSLDLSGITDGKVELFFGEEFRYDYNYDVNAASFLSFNSSSLARIDLNVVVDDLNASTDINRFTYTSAGSTPLKFSFFDDANFFSFDGNINPAAANTLTLYFDDSSATVITFGLVSGSSNSFMIDSNTQNITTFTARVSYTGVDANYVPVYFNAVLRQNNSSYDSNASLRYKN